LLRGEIRRIVALGFREGFKMLRFATRYVVPGLLAIVSSGCAWRITPPATLERPGNVYITSYGKHTRLALPEAAQPGRMIEFGFGDWHYYALEETSLLSGLRALFWSEASALSRRELLFHEDPAMFRVGSGGEHTARIRVEQARIDALRNALEKEWNSLVGESAHRSQEDMSLRRSNARYHLFRNSNHQTADWLRELGCKVNGIAILARFRVVNGVRGAAEAGETGRREISGSGSSTGSAQPPGTRCRPRGAANTRRGEHAARRTRGGTADGMAYTPTAESRPSASQPTAGLA
jgi:hypothetical protein